MDGWTPGRLCRSRIKRFWREQYNVWRTALDWTVWLYFIVPGLWIGGGTYAEIWREPPDWLAALPPGVALVPLAIAVLFGRLRTFLEDADAIFLLQRARWIRALLLGGMHYTLAVQAAAVSLLFVLLLPLLHLAHGWAYIGLWALYTIGVKALFTLLKRLLEARWQGWRRWTLESLVIAGIVALYALPVLQAPGNASVLAGCAVAAFAAWGLAVRAKLRARGAFDTDVREERSARLASTDLLLTPVMERKPTVRFKKPIVFRRSGRLLRAPDAGAALAELRIKSFARKFENVRLWLGFVGVSTTAILVSPGWLGLPIAAVLPLLAAWWVHGQWKEWTEEPYIAQFRWTEAALRRGAALSRFWIVAPAVLWLSGFAGAMYAGWVGALAALPAGIGLWHAANRAMAELLSPAKRQSD